MSEQKRPEWERPPTIPWSGRNLNMLRPFGTPILKWKLNKLRSSNGGLLAGPPVTLTEWQVFRPCLKLWIGVLLSRDVRTHASAYSTRLSITWSQYLSQITSNQTPVRPVAAILWHSSKFTQGRTFINIPFFHLQSFSGMLSHSPSLDIFKVEIGKLQHVKP